MCRCPKKIIKMLKKNCKMTDGHRSCLEIQDRETYSIKRGKSRNKGKPYMTKNTATGNSKMQRKILNTISNTTEMTVRLYSLLSLAWHASQWEI